MGQIRFLLRVSCLFFLLTDFLQAQPNQASSLELIGVAADGRHFVKHPSGAAFQPWGFNYDHDARDRLLETYWEKEWPAVEGDFEEMKKLGANVVRVHLQVGRFMKSASATNDAALDRLGKLVALAEKTGLYLDVTGLGCYDEAEVPAWFDELSEAARWEVQSLFWEGVAQRCRNSPAIFCYDLMNEPVLTEDKEKKDWTPGAFGNRHFVQRLALDFSGRDRAEIAKAWIDKMVSAIRKHDREHLITIGEIPWSMVWPNAKSLFHSNGVGEKLDFVSVHFYPEGGQIKKALDALAVYQMGKPVVIEEIFPLACSMQELDEFIEGSRKHAAGWIGFYWGKTIEEYERTRNEADIGEAITKAWLKYFARKTVQMRNKPASDSRDD